MGRMRLGVLVVLLLVQLALTGCCAIMALVEGEETWFTITRFDVSPSQIEPGGLASFVIEVDVHSPDLGDAVLAFVDVSSGVLYETLEDAQANQAHSPETRMTFGPTGGSGYWRAPAMTGQVLFRASVGASIEERTVTVR